MRKILSLVDHELTWTERSGFKTEYELRFGDDLVATLRFPKTMSSTAEAESGDGSWIFERKGMLKPQTLVRARGSDAVIATFTRNVWKSSGTLELSEGRRVSLSVSTWQRTLEFRTDVGETLMLAKSRGFFRQTVSLQMNRKGLEYPELPWMTMLLLYLVIIMRREAAAHSVVH